MRTLRLQRDMELTALRERHDAVRFGEQARRRIERAARRQEPNPP